MHNKKKISAIADREDISQFVIHLTRSTPNFPDEIPAIDNFISILKARCIEARNPHCLYSQALQKMDVKNRSRFNVACFTEIPLNQIHLLVQQIEGRAIHLKPYGFVFKKEFLLSMGAQPAIYINSYDGNRWLRDAADKLAELALPITRAKRLWRLMPFINAMHERYDFSWEREWRVLGPLQFDWSDLVCVILPEDQEDIWKDRFAGVGMAVISPGWRYEQIVGQLSRQQRQTRKIHKKILEQSKLGKGEITTPKHKRYRTVK
jgi:hypothetical protein